MPPNGTQPLEALPITVASLSVGAGGLSEDLGAESDSFPIIRAGLDGGVIDPADFVESLLTERGASVIYGPSNCGKSFWILDLAVCVATGVPFRGNLEVDRGAVVYVALEGESGIRKRIAALMKEEKLSEQDPLFLCYSPVSLLEQGHASKLAESVKQASERSGLPCRLVILDTLSRAMAGGDENSGQDMTAAIAAIDAIRNLTEAHVAVIHHCGKDEGRGARGHSSLRAAVDTEIEVTRPEGSSITTVRVTKQRDLSVSGPMPFSLKTIALGVGRRGREITSCIVIHEESSLAAKRPVPGRKQELDPVELLSLLPQASIAAWAKVAKDELGISKTSFYRYKDQLVKSGGFISDSGGIRPQ